MPSDNIYPVPSEVAERAWADRETYLKMYQASVDDPEAFWREQGQRVDWIKPFTQVKDVSYATG